MKVNLIIAVLIGGFLTVLTSCEEETAIVEEKENPFELEVGWNGFVFDGTSYDTPNAIIEFFGENIDTLTSNYDVSFTDGTYDPFYRVVSDYSIFVYFDINSPSVEELSTGIYYFKKTPDRIPNIIGSAYIKVPNKSSDIPYTTYLIEGGTVEVSEADGFFLIEYFLKTVKDGGYVDIIGQYTGVFQLIDQTLGSKK